MAEPPSRAARPDTGSSVAPVMTITGAPCVRGLGTSIAPRRRATSRQTLLAGGARVERVPEAVAEQVEGECGEQNEQSGPDHQHRPGRVVLGRGREQVPPARNVERDSDSEEREAGLEEHVTRDDQGGVD